MTKTFKFGALAAALTMAFAAQAAEVTLYGSVSTGLVYKHTNATLKEGQSKNSYGMESGWYGDSNWGLTGSEELANGWKAGFTLESNFNSDDGKMGESGRLFDSQAYLTIGNDFVTFAAGRVGALSSGGGDFDLLGGFDPLEAKFGIGGMGLFASRDIMANNTLAALVTPVEGLTLAGAVSFGVETDGGKWNQNQHYYALAGNYTTDAFSSSLIWERVTVPGADKDMDFYSFGVSYDFGMIKPMFAYQRGQNLLTAGGAYASLLEDEDVANFLAATHPNIDSFLFGATAPVGAGTLMVSYQYMTGKAHSFVNYDSFKFNAHVVGVAYDYPLSNRTSIYTGATWSKGGKVLDKDFGAEVGSEEFNGYQFGVGVKHTF